ncbi:MAG: hypothetical protein AAF960_01180 [Bacteroidota bacterium]
MKNNSLFILFISLLFAACQNEKVFEEKEGYVAVEAEDFHSQTLTDVRKWYRMDEQNTPQTSRDDDANHANTASGDAYLEILPDTRTNHDEPLVRGENFSNEPGQLGVLNYKVKFNTTGKYYVWVRAFSTGTEDNGIHVGLDGEWVESGQRMQWCEGKNQWAWASKQRTKEVHCGVEKQIFLNIETAGVHTISFSMREDGFEFDKWVMSKAYKMPDFDATSMVFPDKNW